MTNSPQKSHPEVGTSTSPFLESLMCILSVRASHPRNGEEGAGQAEGRWAQKRLQGRPEHPEYVKAKAV